MIDGNQWKIATLEQQIAQLMEENHLLRMKLAIYEYERRHGINANDESGEMEIEKAEISD